ncbi:MAG: AmmeMemoRadiSam system protein B [Marinilabiliaceae bacterium]|nr:AmmeMemoRadiSam system protein B [Marinilabiliaceae bacterium]
MQYGIRKPAVAGVFYKNDKNALLQELDLLFSDCESHDIFSDRISALIVPHAGYVFSGKVAAMAYIQLDKQAVYDNIFIIGTSHHHLFEGASIYNEGNFSTPLGEVEVNRELAGAIIAGSDVFNSNSFVHEREHSLEVQLPFLQYRLKNKFKIVPVLIGTSDKDKIEHIAHQLKPFFNSTNLFIVSTDLSHYPNYNESILLDRGTIDAIISNSPQVLLAKLAENEDMQITGVLTSLCGWSSVLCLMYITNNQLVKYQKLYYQNSGDSVYGEKDRVVGYCSIAVVNEVENKKNEFSDAQKKYLLRVVRDELYRAVLPKDLKSRSVTVRDSFFDDLTGGVFVSLYYKGALRGCIGTFDFDRKLIDNLKDVAVSAAINDYRFNPVSGYELADIKIEISVLTPLIKVASIADIQLGKHGVCIKKEGRSGTFLPGVAVKMGWDLETTLGHCAREKAQIGWDGWRDADIYVYEAIVFADEIKNIDYE